MNAPRRILLVLLALALVAGTAYAQVQGTMAFNDVRLQGANPDGFLRLYAPNPVQLGSSISHWDTSMTPSLLMEPAITPSLGFLDLDLTPELMRDIGWSAGTSTFNVINLDPDGVGFTDPRPFAGAPNNPATTLGEARINLFNAVLAAWANSLQSPIEIDVEVTWQPLPCQAGVGAALAGASTILIFQSAAFPFQNTWYPSALAESLLGQNASGDADGDIFVIINSDIDEECLAPGVTYYYGIDGQAPPNSIDLAPVVLHEVGHGLGFANFSNEEDGVFVQGDPSIFDQFTYDSEADKTWAEMSSTERVASAVNTSRVVWNGPLATAGAPNFLDAGVPELIINSPSELAGTYDAGPALFGPSLTAGALTGEIACVIDDTRSGAGDTIFDGCSPPINAAELAGKIALIDRGTCLFTSKVLNAQQAGAVGAIIVDNVADAPISPGGDPSLPVAIPTIGIGKRDGDRLREVLCPRDSILLNSGRFEVAVEWEAPNGNMGTGAGNVLTNDTGYFTFFDPDNVELVVKVLDACNVAGFNSFWVFAAGLTDVEVNITVTDTQTKTVKTYTNPLGTPFQPIQDTNAFFTCP